MDRIRRINNRIRVKQLAIEELKASLLPAAIRYDTDKVQVSPEDRVSEVMAKVDELERQVDKLIAEKAAAIETLEEMFEEMPEPDAEVMTRYCIRCQSVRRIAREMHYSRDGIYRAIRRNRKCLHFSTRECDIT